MVRKEKAAVVCIDYQEKLIPAMCEKVEVVTNSVKLLEGVKALGLPIIITQQYTKGLGETIAEIREAAGVSDHIEKLRYSAFEDIRASLKSPEECPYIIICGVESHVCVLQTAMELKENGYQPLMVVDCVSSRTLFNKKYGIKRAEQEGILLTTYEALLFELQVMAGNDTAKIIQKIVK